MLEYSETDDQPPPPPPEQRTGETDDGWGDDPAIRERRREGSLMADAGDGPGAELITATQPNEVQPEQDDGWGEDEPRRRDQSGQAPPEFGSDLRYAPKSGAEAPVERWDEDEEADIPHEDEPESAEDPKARTDQADQRGQRESKSAESSDDPDNRSGRLVEARRAVDQAGPEAVAEERQDVDQAAHDQLRDEAQDSSSQETQHPNSEPRDRQDRQSEPEQGDNWDELAQYEQAPESESDQLSSSPNREVDDARDQMEAVYAAEPADADDVAREIADILSESDLPSDDFARYTALHPSDAMNATLPIDAYIDHSDAQHCESLDEAKQYAETLGIESSDFTGCDQQSANEVNSTLEANLDRYPEVHRLRNVSTIEQRNDELTATPAGREFVRLHPEALITDDRVMGATLNGAGAFDGIAIAESRVADYDINRRDMEQQVGRGEHPVGTGSLAGVITHEFGHVLDNDLRQCHPEIYAAEVQPAIDAVVSNGKQWVGENVSTYAAGSDLAPVPERELVAEAYSEYQLSDKPRVAARIIGTALDRAYNKAYTR
jgi:hypothetical protein